MSQRRLVRNARDVKGFARRIRHVAGALVLLGSCGGCHVTPLAASGGDPGRTPLHLHQPEAGDGDHSLRGIVVYLSVVRPPSMLAVRHDPEIIRSALADEITARGGMVVDQPSVQALQLTMTLSRYETVYLSAMPASSRSRTLLDFVYRVDHAEGSHLPAEGVRSIYGSGSSANAAHRAVLKRLMGIVLEDSRFTTFLVTHRVSTEGLLGLRLERLAGDLHSKADTSLKTQKAKSPVCVALAPLKGDASNGMAAQLLPSLMKHFTSPGYRFFTRTQLENILQEQALQMSDLVDQRTTVAAGRLQGVDYLVSGLVEKRGADTTIQVEMVSVASGEVLASAAVVVRD